MKNKNEIASRSWGIFILFAVLGLGIFAKVLHIQFFQAEKWKTYAAHLEQRVQDIEPSRGQIYSSDGSLLATSIPRYKLYWDSKARGIEESVFEAKLDSLCQGLALYVGARSAADYKQTLLEAKRRGRRYQLVAKRLDYNQMRAIDALPFISLGRNASGFIFEEEDKREKPFNELAARTIGIYRDQDKVGMELAYNEELAGRNGKQLMERIAGNIWTPATDRYIIEPREGLDVVSTINMRLQDVAQSALLKQLEHHSAAWGTVILMEVETGYIRAISNLKRNEEKGTYAEVFNFAIGEAVEPGSTFKLASMMALLEEGLVSLTDSVDTGNGVHEFYGKPMRDSNAHEGGSGKITVADVFAKSSNVGTALLIQEHFGQQPQRFLDKLNDFGLGDQLGIRLKGESGPQVYKQVGEGSWSGLSVTQMAIGYEVLQSPIHTLALYAAIANGGKLVRPQFAEALRENGSLVHRYEPEILREQICSQRTIDQCRRMMEMVCEPGGTADYVFAKAPYKVAGKTGTAKVAHSRGYYPDRYRASFAGYFPADNPRYACVVMINDTKTGVYYGSSVAGPVFREVADKIYASQLDLHERGADEYYTEAPRLPVSRNGSREDLEVVYRSLGIPFNLETNGEWVKVSTQESSVSMRATEQSDQRVPDVRGMGLQDALHLLENSGLRVIAEGTGTVRHQSVNPGTPIKSLNSIRIELS